MKKSLCLAAAFAAGLFSSPAAAPVPFEAGPGSELFTNGPVLEFKLEISKVGMDWLRKDPRRHVPAKVTVGTNEFIDVAAHLKGAAGSFRGVDDPKPAFTLGFGKFTPDQEFHVLNKIHLNNSVQDPSYSTEWLCGWMMHQAGVPAARTTHARVWLNGRHLGFYTLKEGFGKEFLGRYFKSTKGNLYDGGFLREITDPLEKDMGANPEDRADLKALAAAAQESDPLLRWARLDQVLDLDRFVSYMAMEILTWDWDGYPLNRNNYRIYHDPTTDKLVFIPHGMDQMYQNPTANALRPNFNSLLASAIMKTPQGRQLYKERLGLFFTNLCQIEVLTNKLAELHARNRPTLAAIGENVARDLDGQVNAVRDRMTQRWNSIRKEFSQPEPKPVGFTNGIARIAGWRVAEERPAEKGSARLEQLKESDGRQTLSILATTNSTASWRSKMLLEGGRYRFEGLARSAQIVNLPVKLPPQPAPEPIQNQAPPVTEKKGEGAGLRISGTQKPRENKVSGDATWTKLEYEFDVVPPNDEVELVCELRAKTGQVWFDLESLRLVRIK